MNDKILDEFWTRHDHYYRSRTDPNMYGTSEYHEELANFLKFVKASPQARDGLARCFVQLVEGLKDVHSKASYTWDLIPFCMRELQWPEVKTAIEKEIERSTDNEVIPFLKAIRSAYNPVWVDESAFVYYIEKAKKEGRIIPPRYPPKMYIRIIRFLSAILRKKK